jgi:RNA polymerase sigma-70 factor (ECF subfamily)
LSSPANQESALEQFFREHIRDGAASRGEFRRFLELLFEEHGESVYLALYARVGNIEDARDLCQETFYLAYRWLVSGPGYSEGTRVNFAAWLHRIARNQASKLFRKRRTRRERGLPEEAERGGDPPREKGDPADDPGVGLEREDARQLLAACLEELSERHRIVVIRRLVEKRPSAEVAEEITVRPDNVRAILHRARKRLQDRLLAKGVDLAWVGG